MNINYKCYEYKITGSSHHKNNTPCQDFVRKKQFDESAILVACDGAGSAKRAKEGSEIFSEFFLNALIEINNKITKSKPGDWLVDEVVKSVVKSREGLRSKTNSNELAEFHTTLVSSVVRQNGGFFAHVGDGFGIALTNIEQSLNVASSEPENGEYANETFFVTENNWIKHLRITPYTGTPLFVAVMSDGAASLFFKGNEPDIGLIKEFIIKFLYSKNRLDFLKEYFNSESANQKSNDDKSISFMIADTDINYFVKMLGGDNTLKKDDPSFTQTGIAGKNTNNIPNVFGSTQKKTNLFKILGSILTLVFLIIVFLIYISN